MSLRGAAKPRQSNLNIGILGGSFDPIHKAHLVLAKQAKKELKLDEVLFVPCYLAPHRSGKKVTAVRHRSAMVQRVVKKFKKFRHSNIEIKRKGRSYTIDTLRQLARKYPKGTQFYFILGTDSWRQIKTWKRVKKLFEYCRFVIFNRKGYPFKSFKDLPKPIRLKIKPVEISSTEIRRKIRKGKSVKQAVPKEALAYIKEKELYQ